jgi:hypothetical protein
MTSTRFLSRKDHRSNKNADGEDLRCIDIGPGEQRPSTIVMDEEDLDGIRSEDTAVVVDGVRL